jgi:UDP-glucose 4-epimerase
MPVPCPAAMNSSQSYRSGPEACWLQAYGEVFNVGGDMPYTVNELAQMVAHALGVSPDIHYLPERNEVKHAFSSHDKVRRYFELPAPVSLNEGVARMAAWARQTGSREIRNFTNIEIPRGLPLGW